MFFPLIPNVCQFLFKPKPKQLFRMRVKVPLFADTSLAQENILYQFSTDGITWTNITTTATGSGELLKQATNQPK